MAKESTFEHPPKGHVGMLGYDSVDDDFPTMLVDSDGHPQVDIIDSGGADLKDILDKLTDILTELNAKLETADLEIDSDGVLSVLRNPLVEYRGDWTDKDTGVNTSTDDDDYLEVFSNSTAGSAFDTTGYTPADGKTVYVAYASGSIYGGGTMQLMILWGNTVMWLFDNSSPIQFTPPYPFKFEGDGSTVLRVQLRNETGATATCRVSVRAFEI